MRGGDCQEKRRSWASVTLLWEAHAIRHTETKSQSSESIRSLKSMEVYELCSTISAFPPTSKSFSPSDAEDSALILSICLIPSILPKTAQDSKRMIRNVLHDCNEKGTVSRLSSAGGKLSSTTLRDSNSPSTVQKLSLNSFERIQRAMRKLFPIPKPCMIPITSCLQGGHVAL